MFAKLRFLISEDCSFCELCFSPVATIKAQSFKFQYDITIKVFNATKNTTKNKTFESHKDDCISSLNNSQLRMHSFYYKNR